MLQVPYQVRVGHEATLALVVLLVVDDAQGLGVLHGLADVLRLEVHPALVQELFNVLNAGFEGIFGCMVALNHKHKQPSQ